MANTPITKRQAITGLYWVVWSIFLIIASTPLGVWAEALVKSHALIYFVVGVLVILFMGWLSVLSAGVSKEWRKPISFSHAIVLAFAVCLWAWVWPLFAYMAALAYGFFKIETRKGDWI